MIPTVTTGNDFVGTLSRSGNTGGECTSAWDLTIRHSAFILADASGSARQGGLHDGNTGSLGAFQRARLASERGEPHDERAPRGQRARDPELDPDGRRLGGRGRARLRV